jgi:hypothetical protein
MTNLAFDRSRRARSRSAAEAQKRNQTKLFADRWLRAGASGRRGQKGSLLAYGLGYL